VPITQFNSFQKVFLPEFISILRESTFENNKWKMLQENQEKESKPKKKIENKVEKGQTSGFVQHAVQFAKTANVDYDEALDRIYQMLLNKKTNEDFRDKLSFTVIYPLLHLCQEKDFLQDGMC